MDMKLIILGLDGLSWHVLNEFIKDLPNLSKLKESGAWANLKTVNPPVTAPAWVSFQTAQDIGNHGFTSFEAYDDKFNPIIRDGRTLNSITYYEILEKVGYKQLIFNLPYSNPARIAGDVIHSWLVYKADPREMVHPPSLYDELENLKNHFNIPKLAPEHKEKFFKQFVEIARGRFDLLKEAISKKDYDAVFCLVGETDVLQHAAYPDIINGAGHSHGRSAMAQVLKVIDDFIGWLFDQGFNGNIVLMSDHGFQNFKGAFYTNQWLEKMDYLAFSSTGKPIKDAQGPKANLNVGRLISLLRKQPKIFNLVKWVYSRFLTNLISVDYSDVIDLDKTVAFMPSSAEMMIHLRTQGRMPQQEAEGLAARIIEEINGLGLPVKAMSSRDAFRGRKCIESIPPIVLYSENVRFKRGVGASPYCPDENNFWHSHWGIFLGHGPHFREGHKIEKMHITDAIPTTFAALGIPLSDTFDGTVKQEALKSSYTETIKRYDWSHTDGDRMDKKEEEKIVGRLKDLGYL